MEQYKEIYVAGGCFWGTEKLFQSIRGVVDTECGYANGKTEIVPDYKLVCTGETGYRETVRVRYDPKQVSLQQLLKAFFHVIDPTTEKQQGEDVGDQYQTGLYTVDLDSGKQVAEYVAEERKKYPVFAVEVGELAVFHAAEEYHQDYLVKNPDGYCHIRPAEFARIRQVIGQEE